MNFFSKQGKPSALSICDKTVQKLLRYYKNAKCQLLLINQHTILFSRIS